MDKLKIEQVLNLDQAQETARITNFIREQLSAFQRKGIVIGLSGGLDSAVTAALAVQAVGADSVTLINLPDRDSSPVHRRHARQFANHLGTEFVVRSITPILRAMGSYRLLPLGLIPGRALRARLVRFGKKKFLRNEDDSLLADRLRPPKNKFVARGNTYAIAKHRTRMIALYQYAEIHDLMVIGAANRTEALTGTFSKWGVDHCADVMPIIHLYRSQVERLGAFLGLPDYLLNKAADPDVIPGVNDKGALLGDFETADQILFALGNGASVEDLAVLYPAEIVQRLAELHALSTHMRQSPYQLAG